MNSGLLTNSSAATLTVDGQFNWASGTIALPVTLSAGATMNLTGAGTKIIYRVTIDNQGTINWTDSGALNFNHAAYLNNYGTINVLGDGVMTRTAGVFATFRNFGTFNKLASTNLLLSAVTFEHYGTLNIAQGRLTYGGGNHFWADGAVVTGAGKCVIHGGMLQVNGTPDVGVPFTMMSGSLSGNGVFRKPLDFAGGSITGEITAHSTVNWTGGQIQGKLTITETGTLNLSGPNTKSFWFGQLDNYGTAVWTGTGPIEVDTSSVINNYGLFHAQNDAGWIWNNGSAPVFNNYGTFRKSVATGVSPLGAVQFANWGTFDVQSGTVSWTKNVNTFHEGSVFLGAGTNLVDGATILLRGVVGAGSTLNFASGAIGGGTFAGTVNWTGGRFSDTITFAPGSRLNVLNGGFKSLSAATLINAGTVNWATTNAVLLDAGARLLNRGLFRAASGGSLIASNPPTATFENAGTLDLGSGETKFSLQGAFQQVAGGRLLLEVSNGRSSWSRDKLRVFGPATLDGAVDLSFAGVYTPARGDRVNLLTAQSVTGALAEALNGGRWLAPEYTLTNVTLVADVPALLAQPQSQTVDRGVTASFAAQVNRAAAVQWHFSRWVEGGTRVTVPLPGATQPTLVLPNAQTRDEGDYYLVATNVWGAVTSAWARLAIYVAPTITAQPQGLTVVAGNSASLSVAVSGSGPFRYQWKRDGNNLAGQTNAVLALLPAAAGDAGKYKVTITDGRVTLTSAEVTLTVLVPPSITEQPQSKNVNNGSDVKLEVKATGTAPLGYQWFKEGLPLAGANGNALAFGHIKKEQAGTYHVLVTNTAGAVLSAAAVVQINEPPTILGQPASQSVSAGSEVVLNVWATGVPAPTYQWRLNGVNIPGATNATLVIQNVEPRHSGQYSVVVKNSLGSVNSAVAYLRVQVPTLPFADHFAERGVIYTTNGFGRGANCGATKQASEPSHAGKGSATNSVWLTWWAPANGIATFSTLGSDFDTVLAVYRGTNIAALTKVVADDDAAGFHCSKVSFNAQAGTYYQIAVAGLGRACGDIVLNWDLLQTSEQLPDIIQAPQDFTGKPHDTLVLQVLFNAFEPTAIQWFHEGRLLPGATNTLLVIENLQAEKVGGYAVRLTSPSGRTVVSPPGDVQINTEGLSTVAARNKFADSLDFALIGSDGEASGVAKLSGTGSPTTRGYTGSQIFSTYGADKDDGEPNHCGLPGGASSWFFYQAPRTGTMIVDTEGSTFDTVLAVYTGPGTDFASLVPVACDNDSGSDGRCSKVMFTAIGGTMYFMAVDGVNGASGTVRLNYVLGDPPTITTNPASCVVPQGGTATLKVAAVAAPKATFQWLFEDAPIPGATNATLTIANFHPRQAGRYRAKVKNALGAVSSEPAELLPEGPLKLKNQGRSEQGGFKLAVTGSANRNYVLEASTNLTHWLPLATNFTATGLLDFTDPQAAQFPNRYYRVRPLP